MIMKKNICRSIVDGNVQDDNETAESTDERVELKKMWKKETANDDNEFMATTKMIMTTKKKKNMLTDEEVEVEEDVEEGDGRMITMSLLRTTKMMMTMMAITMTKKNTVLKVRITANNEELQ